jgi:hypothetical protein
VAIAGQGAAGLPLQSAVHGDERLTVCHVLAALDVSPAEW